MLKRRNHQVVNSYVKPITSMKTNNIINKVNDDINHHNNKVSVNDGITRAYDSPNSIFIDGNRMYISGTHSLRDVYDDVTKIPVWGDLRNSERYQQADEALKNNPQIDTIYAHSLGGSVALEINKNNDNKFKTITYGAPVLDFSFNRDPNNMRYRHPGDKISMFDTGAVNEDNNTTYNLINPHSFSGFPDDNDDNDK